jgi:hypothetical protein
MSVSPWLKVVAYGTVSSVGAKIGSSKFIPSFVSSRKCAIIAPEPLPVDDAEPATKTAEPVTKAGAYTRPLLGSM